MLGGTNTKLVILFATILLAIGCATETAQPPAAAATITPSIAPAPTHTNAPLPTYTPLPNLYAIADLHTVAYSYAVPHGYPDAGANRHAPTNQYPASDEHTKTITDAQSLRQVAAG